MEPEPISRKLSFSDFAAILGMGFFLLIVEALALFLVRPFQENNMQIFEEPTSIWNPVAYIVIILSFTIFILITLRYGKKWMVQAFIGFAVMSTLLIIFDVFTSRILPQYIASPAALALTVFSAV
ncbi:MAG: presenilin family intramembrane aspartyl protease, partial [Halobacteria archaeon]